MGWENRWVNLQLLHPAGCSIRRGRAVSTVLFPLITESPEIQVSSRRWRKEKGWHFLEREQPEASFMFITVRRLEQLRWTVSEKILWGKTQQESLCYPLQSRSRSSLFIRKGKGSQMNCAKLRCNFSCPLLVGKTKPKFYRKQTPDANTSQGRESSSRKRNLKLPDPQPGQR